MRSDWLTHSAGRWLVSGMFIVIVHGAAAWALLPQPEPAAEFAPAGALTLELAPIALARADLAAEITPGPDQVQATASPEQPKPAEETPIEEPRPQIEPAERKPEFVRAPDPEALPVAEEKSREEAPAVAAPAPSPAAPTTSASQVEAERKAEVAVGTVRGAPGVAPSIALPRWTNRLIEQIERSKRYPAAAQSRREEGTALVAFSIDRRGQLLTAQIQKSSGSALLDAEALEILRRAQPFPVPPSELAGEHITLAVPIRFRVRG